MTDDAPYVFSADVFKLWMVDRRSQQFRVVLQNGETHTEPMNLDEALRTSEVAMMIFDWERWRNISITTREHAIVAEAYSPFQEDPLHGRATVYLDQNHWSTVALARVAPERVKNRDELAAACELIRLATDGGIVLPLSSGHMLETAGLYGDKRYDLGVAMASLTGGWQLRHPMSVWRHEAAEMFADVLGEDRPGSPPVITLEPNALMSEGKRAADFEPDSQELFEYVMSSAATIADMLLHPETSERGNPTVWLDRQVAVTAEVTALSGTASKRRLALRRFWEADFQPFFNGHHDLKTDQPLPHLNDRQLVSSLASMPMVGYLSGLFTQRYLNGTTVWKPNDLVDMLFLSCAAGYADFVAAEAHTGTQLAQLQRTRGKPQTVFTTLHGMVEALLESGAQTATERGEG
ncbi:hypothetical protein [Aeromicrobium ginsengisoli]|uniref:Uncharacterized protein n=1 Tax=Aeromicrobium ginsengisoli TaxID=363867 RepID=A0A5M4FJI1_9ACTN|nr:hypothetical protein [Aeromicrobium ginsengisoli]KAA1399913.1 hypothetical protein ESP70_003925 [Aeromicrobium ginsengisoli]